jgi:hypothetical protein
VCEENHGLEENDIPWDKEEKTFRYQTGCPFWKNRESVGTYKFGHTYIKKD